MHCACHATLSGYAQVGLCKAW